MFLEPEDRREFFEIWLRLLAFVNEKHKVVKGFGHPKTALKIKPETTFKIKEKLWQDVGIIDEYIDSARDLSEGNTEILISWKKSIPGHFFIMRHLKKYSVFLGERGDESFLYGVHGISTPLSDAYPQEILPKMVETTLMPYKGIIIYDTIFQAYNVRIGPNMRRDLNFRYFETKKNKGIVAEL